MGKDLRIPLVALSAACLLAAGCSRQAPAAIQPKLSGMVSACGLLDRSEASSVLGGEVKVTRGPEVTRPAGDVSVSNCGFASDQARTVNLLLRRSADASALAQEFAAARAAARDLYGVGPSDVPGLGEAAFWIGGTVNQLELLKGGSWITVMVFGLSSDDRLAIARKTAAAISPKL